MLKNLLKIYALDAVNRIHTEEGNLKNLFTGLEKRIDEWAGLPTDGDTIGNSQRNSKNLPGSDSPQANWGLHHFKSNMGQVSTKYKHQDSENHGALQTIFDDLEKMVDQEGAAFMAAFQKLKDDVIEAQASLTLGELVKRITAILLDLLLTTAENLLVTGMDIIAAVIGTIVDMLDAPIKIPVISAIYREFADADLSILDLMCLVAAIPVTVIYKLVKDETPFPDNDLTNRMKTASDLAAFREVLQSSRPKSSTAVAQLQHPPVMETKVLQTPKSQLQKTEFDGDDPHDVMTVVLDMVGYIGAMLTILISGAKRERWKPFLYGSILLLLLPIFPILLQIS
ncbi:MAG TPA: hypothetical protein VFE38_15355 [Edaphobacter sp.]|nr:hypothetical protein [Edaphobacter sp.]